MRGRSLRFTSRLVRLLCGCTERELSEATGWTEAVPVGWSEGEGRWRGADLVHRGWELLVLRGWLEVGVGGEGEERGVSSCVERV
jgi:hypothetical protein